MHLFISYFPIGSLFASGLAGFTKDPQLSPGFPQATEKFGASRAPELDGADAYSSE